MIRARKIYASCSDLPLYNFIKVVVHDDLNWLYSENKSILTHSIDLQPVWNDIFSEYTTILDNPRSKHVFALTREIALMNSRLSVIENTVKYLSKVYDVRLCDVLRRMGFRYKFTPESLENDLKLTISSAKSMVIRRQEAEIDYKKLDQSSEKVTEADFYGLVREICRFNSFHIDPKKTTVTEFVNDINAFNLVNRAKNG